MSTTVLDDKISFTDEDNQAYELLNIIRWLLKLSEKKDIIAISITVVSRNE